MQDQYGIAAFRSRQQVLRFEDALRREGVQTSVVTTPRAVALGCGRVPGAGRAAAREPRQPDRSLPRGAGQSPSERVAAEVTLRLLGWGAAFRAKTSLDRARGEIV